MTPEEKAVIQAAITWRESFVYKDAAMIGAGPIADAALAKVIDALILSLPPPVIDREAEENAALESGVPPEWVPAVFLLCLAGDRIRIGEQETDVIRSNAGVWHVDTSDYWQPKTWPHTELRMDLAANPGFREYPPQTPCEILCTPERRAVLEVMRAFPGTQRVDG